MKTEMGEYTKNLKERLGKLNSEFVFDYISDDHTQFHLPDYRLSRLLSNCEEMMARDGEIFISIKTLQNAIDFADKTYHNTQVADAAWVKCLKYKLFGPDWADLEKK